MSNISHLLGKFLLIEKIIRLNVTMSKAPEEEYLQKQHFSFVLAIHL